MHAEELEIQYTFLQLLLTKYNSIASTTLLTQEARKAVEVVEASLDFLLLLWRHRKFQVHWGEVFDYGQAHIVQCLRNSVFAAPEKVMIMINRYFCHKGDLDQLERVFLGNVPEECTCSHEPQSYRRTLLYSERAASPLLL